MTELTTFQFHTYNLTAFADENGNPWVNANEVCAILGYANPRKAVADHCRADGVTKRYTIDSMGRHRSQSCER